MAARTLAAFSGSSPAILAWISSSVGPATVAGAAGAACSFWAAASLAALAAAIFFAFSRAASCSGLTTVMGAFSASW